MLLAWGVRASLGRRSTTRRWRRFAPASAAATPTSDILGELRASAERLGRSPTMREFAGDEATHRAPADGHRALRVVERRQAAGGPRAAPRPLARRPRRAAARAGGGARTDADRARPRRAPRADAVEVALLAHVRLADAGAARGRVRRPGGGGAARARGGAGRRAGAPARPPAEVRRLGARRGGPTRRCSPSGRSTGCSSRGAGPGRRSSTSSARRCSSRARTCGRTERVR